MAAIASQSRAAEAFCWRRARVRRSMASKRTPVCVVGAPQWSAAGSGRILCVRASRADVGFFPSAACARGVPPVLVFSAESWQTDGGPLFWPRDVEADREDG